MALVGYKYAQLKTGEWVKLIAVSGVVESNGLVTIQFLGLTEEDFADCYVIPNVTSEMTPYNIEFISGAILTITETASGYDNMLFIPPNGVCEKTSAYALNGTRKRYLVIVYSGNTPIAAEKWGTNMLNGNYAGYKVCPNFVEGLALQDTIPSIETRKAYIGVNGVARKIKNGYIGVENIARRIKKAYIGIGGVARPCWADGSGSGELAYYGAITPRSVAVGESAGASIGNYALFGGGSNGSTVYNYVDAYDSTLTKTTPTSLQQKKSLHTGTSNGRYALFGFGSYASIDAYDESLTRSNPSGAAVSYKPAATSIGRYALFGGGASSTSWSTARSTVWAFDEDLTKATPTSLSSTKAYLGGASNGTYALFGGGFGKSSGPFYSTVDAYDETLTRTTPTALSIGRSHNTGAARAGNHAVFAGGYSGSANLATADAYDSDLTRTLPAPLDSACHRNSAASLGDFALFNCGAMGSANINVYDAALVHTIPGALESPRGDVVGVTVGNYALFGGGTDNDAVGLTTVDAFTLV